MIILWIQDNKMVKALLKHKMRWELIVLHSNHSNMVYTHICRLSAQKTLQE